MKKILFFIIFFLPLFSIKAQLQSQQLEVEKIVHKVDSIEHELSYLRLSYELYTLNSDIKTFTDEVNIKILEIKMDLYHQCLENTFGDLLQRYYNKCEQQKLSYADLIKAKKSFIAVKVLTCPFTDEELDVLMSSYNIVEDRFELLENSLDLLKEVIRLYKENL